MQETAGNAHDIWLVQNRVMLLVTNARLITIAPVGPDVIDEGWMLVADDGRIDSVGSGTPPRVEAAEVLDVGGSFVAPGFVSSHSHLFTSGLRGLGVDATLYGWCDSMLGFTANASAENIYWSSLHGSLDFLSNGVTTAFDFTDPRLSWVPMIDGVRSGNGVLRDIDYVLRQADAKADSGIRYINAVGMDVTVGSDDEIFERFAAVVAHDARADPSQMLGSAVFGAVQWSPRRDAAELEVEAMRRFGVINQAHFLETREEVELQRSKFEWYAEADALGPSLVFGHFIQTTAEIIDRAASAGSGMSWQPASNGRLASGIADLPRMREKGMTIGVGLDDQACTDISDPWQNMRIGIYQQRAATGDPNAMSPADMLRMHTLGSAQVLGIADRVGSLEPGKFADFVVVDPRSPDMGPLWHPIDNYVLSSSLRNLKQVYVGGRLVNENGISTSPLAAEATAKVHEQLPAIAAQHGWPA
ncbi:8-oxoguanine deaminase [Salinibacterium xinjiangense]|uniref:Cytosine/adenosine deaminase n=2 Tax=Salinibacterium xinjiangense TaxID=386302 RepID=A0A2C8YRV5_9MICO|nr:8-oxoguanine deaminase [Salinibacterium xinjiangense]SOE53324.1 Cytosine/adenosine deaminase [Salinibacterium xinjiangense]